MGKDKQVFVTQNSYSVFHRPNKGFVYLREHHLAFGNKGVVIEYTSSIEYAELFRPTVKELEAKDFYHKFPSVLEAEISQLKHHHITVKTTKEFSFD